MGVQTTTKSQAFTASSKEEEISSHQTSSLHFWSELCFRAHTRMDLLISRFLIAIPREAPSSPGPNIAIRLKIGMNGIVLTLYQNHVLFTSSMMEKNFKEQGPKDDEWGNPPSPNTPENNQKVFRAQMILGIVALIFISLPAIVLWLVKK